MEMLIPIILALISFFGAKKSGMKTGQAAAVGLAVGAGSYYVATETEWGKSLFGQSSTDWVRATDAQGNPVTDSSGNPVYVPSGEKPVLDANGKPVTAADGTWFTKTLDTTGKVLSSWGGAGTAAVIGATGAVTGSGIFDGKYTIPLLLGGGLLLMVALK